MKDYDFVKFAHRFHFHDQCHFCISSTKHRIRPKRKSNSNPTEKWVCKSDGFGFVKKRRNLTDSKSVISPASLQVHDAAVRLVTGLWSQDHVMPSLQQAPLAACQIPYNLQTLHQVHFYLVKSTRMYWPVITSILWSSLLITEVRWAAVNGFQAWRTASAVTEASCVLALTHHCSVVFWSSILTDRLTDKT